MHERESRSHARQPLSQLSESNLTQVTTSLAYNLHCRSSSRHSYEKETPGKLHNHESKQMVEWESHYMTIPLDGVLPGPFPRCSFIAGTVGFVNVSDFRNERVIGIRVCEHRADRQENYKQVSVKLNINTGR